MEINNIYKKFAQASLKIMPGFKIDSISNVVILFFSRHRADQWKSLVTEPNKGLILCGAKGIGKTVNFRILCRVITENTQYIAKLISVKEIQSQYRLNQEAGKGEEYLQTLINTPFLVIDDLGNEETQLNDFGTKKNLIAEILFQRYILFQRGKYWTYATTNLKHTHLEQIYDPRLIDRMKEMFVFHIVSESQSKRTNPVKEVQQVSEPLPQKTEQEKRIEYLEWYKSNCKEGYITDFKDITWSVLLKNKIVDSVMLRRFDIKEQAQKICEKEKLKKDLMKAVLIDEVDVEKVSKYLLMKDIIQTVDFNKIEVI